VADSRCRLGFEPFSFFLEHARSEARNFEDDVHSSCSLSRASVTAKTSEMVETRLKMAALRAEHAELLRLRSVQDINDETLNKLMREVDLSETAIVNRKRGTGG